MEGGNALFKHCWTVGIWICYGWSRQNLNRKPSHSVPAQTDKGKEDLRAVVALTGPTHAADHRENPGASYTTQVARWGFNPPPFLSFGILWKYILYFHMVQSNVTNSLSKLELSYVNIHIHSLLLTWRESLIYTLLDAFFFHLIYFSVCSISEYMYFTLLL